MPLCSRFLVSVIIPVTLHVSASRRSLILLCLRLSSESHVRDLWSLHTVLPLVAAASDLGCCCIRLSDAPRSSYHPSRYHTPIISLAQHHILVSSISITHSTFKLLDVTISLMLAIILASSRVTSSVAAVIPSTSYSSPICLQFPQIFLPIWTCSFLVNLLF